MNEDIFPYLLHGAAAVNAGPNAKELFLEQAENEYNNGNLLPSIFYQVRSLFQSFQERYYQFESGGKQEDAENIVPLDVRLLKQMNDWEKEDIRSNPLMQYALKIIKETNPSDGGKFESQLTTCNFLLNVVDPLKGVKKIEEICQQMPKEWTILQLCKGPRPETTYSVYPQIHESDAAIYVTIFRHARSAKYPSPICLRFAGSGQVELFKKFGSIANHFKECIYVDPKECNTKDAKQQYWGNLGEFNHFISIALIDMKNFFYPWSFLFTGIPTEHTSSSTTATKQNEAKTFNIIDDFCHEHRWTSNERVLFSLTALHIEMISELETHAICKILSSNEHQQTAAVKLLLKLRCSAEAVVRATQGNTSSTSLSKHYPCILIVDERLDHFFWEELNVQQEFCRVNSLQCLWRLFQLYKKRIHNGYLKVNITDGGCLVNPDNNLPKTELRMKRFFEYWTPHWLRKIGEKPTQDELFNDLFKRSCYVYAGHGSGLQYINGRHIAKQQMNCVVFLFGCDSSRLHSNGLYSELVGPHFYYHAAMCPTLVGTLMPGLDANMDSVATEILSRWIVPKSKNVLPWNEIDRTSWIKEGVVKWTKDGSGIVKSKNSKANPPTLSNTPDYQMASLCAILARIHQRLNETKYYNTVPYVCRGLPAWNCNVEMLPK